MTRATRPSFSSAFCVENRPRIEAICVGIWYDTMLCQSINPALSSAEGFSKINWLIMFMLRVSSAWRKSQQQIYHRLCHENAWKRIKNEKIELFCIRPVPIHQFWWMHSHSQFIPKNSECIQFTIHFEKKWIHSIHHSFENESIHFQFMKSRNLIHFYEVIMPHQLWM